MLYNLPVGGGVAADWPHTVHQALAHASKHPSAHRSVKAK